jgi:hypothetical protein
MDATTVRFPAMNVRAKNRGGDSQSLRLIQSASRQSEAFSDCVAMSSGSCPSKFSGKSIREHSHRRHESVSQTTTGSASRLLADVVAPLGSLNT